MLSFNQAWVRSFPIPLHVDLDITYTFCEHYNSQHNDFYFFYLAPASTIHFLLKVPIKQTLLSNAEQVLIIQKELNNIEINRTQNGYACLYHLLSNLFS